MKLLHVANANTNTVEIASVLLPLDAIYIAVRRISGNNAFNLLSSLVRLL